MTDDDTGWDLNIVGEIFDASLAADLDDPGPLADEPDAENLRAMMRAELMAKFVNSLPPADSAPSVDELLGIDPGWTGELTTDEYIEKIRNMDWLAVHDGNYPHEPED